MKQSERYRCISLQQLVSGDGFVQTGFAHVDVAFLGKGWEQSEQSLRVHVVIIIYMTKPPEQQHREEITFYYTYNFLFHFTSPYR